MAKDPQRKILHVQQKKKRKKSLESLPLRDKRMLSALLASIDFFAVKCVMRNTQRDNYLILFNLQVNCIIIFVHGI